MIFDVDVVVVGAGPAGLLLAGDLAQAGVSCVVLERRPGRSSLSRAFAVQARTLRLALTRYCGSPGRSLAQPA
jgi:2-polyprenyl-6-methoxyphenol hydroxylase-like FAD-dependent oxidoreductase